MYGFWTLLGTFIGYYGLLDFGLSSAAARYISQSLGKGDMEELNSVANTAFFLFSLVGLAVMLAAALSALAAPLFLREPAELSLFRKLILILGAATAIGFPFRVFGGIMTSYIRYDSIAGISIARTILSNAAIYYFLSKGSGIMAVAVVSFIFSLLQNAATYAVCKTHYPRIKIICFRFDGAKIRTMFEYSWKSFVCQIGDLMRFQIDSLLIAGFLNVSLVTPYFIAARLVSGLNQLVISSVGIMLPVFSRYEGHGDYDAIRDALLKVTTISALLSAFVGLSIIFYAKAFVLRWMGPGFESSHVVAAILCAGAIMGLAQYPGVQLLYGLSKNNILAVMNTCQAALSVLLSVALLRHYGLYGVALGSAAETIIFTLFIQPVYICRSVRMPVRLYLLDAILVPMLKAAAPLAVYFYLIQDLVVPDYTRLFACAALQALLFAPVAYFFIIGDDERRFLKSSLPGFTSARVNKNIALRQWHAAPQPGIIQPMITSSAGTTAEPFVSVVIPCRNEAAFIRRVIDSLLASAHPRERLEVVFVDGMSTDGTKAILQNTAREHGFIRVIDNPLMIAPAAMNLGIKATRGEIIVRIDAHAEYPRDYIPRCVRLLRSGPKIGNAGGRSVPLPNGESPWARAVAFVTAHRFGVGDSAFRTSSRPGRVDTVPCGTFHRRLFDEVGLYDERLTRNQDNELNARIQGAGYSIVFDPSIHIHYRNQPNLKGLLRQAYHTGMWNVYTLRLHPYTWKWRRFVPMCFVAYLAVLAAAASARLPGTAHLAAPLGLYAVLAAAFSAGSGETAGGRLRVAATFVSYHLSYGAGSLVGIGNIVSGRWRADLGRPLCR